MASEQATKIRHFPPKHILWAVDVKAEDLESQRPAAWLVRDLSKRFGATVEPVSLFPAGPYSDERDVPVELIEREARESQDALELLLRRVSLPGMRPLRALPLASYRNRSAAERLALTLSASSADLVVVGTHARRGLKRLFSGSFAESLITQSPVPILVVNPGWNLRRDYPVVVYTTDLTNPPAVESRQLLSAVALCRGLGSKLLILHRLMPPPAVPSEALSWPGAFGMVRADAEQALCELVLQASAEGIEAESRIEASPGEDVADAVVRAARELGGIVFLQTRKGPLAAALLGSTARRLVREAPVPLWVVHEPALKAQAA